MDPKVSIVIIGRNEERSIGACIDAALAAADQIGGAEMIYVDSHSTDNTVTVVKEYGVRVEMLNPELRRCPSAGRYAGSMIASGEYILFLDADTHIYPDFLPTAIKYLAEDPALGGVNGQIDDLNEFGEQIFDVDERSDDVMEVKWLRGPSCFFRRKAIIDAGSFNPDLAIEEEAELGLRIVNSGWTLKVIPAPMSCHTRCFHPNSITSTVSTFIRDIRSKRLGEMTRTIAYAFQAGNGFAFCWLRLKTTILFAAWLFLIGIWALMPAKIYPQYEALAFIFLGVLAIFARKRSLSQTLIFVPAKLLCLIDLFWGLHFIRIKKPSIAVANGSKV